MSGQTPADFRPILHLWDAVIYPQWATLETSIRTNARTYGWPQISPEQHHVFTMGVAAMTAPSAHALVQTYDFGPHKRVLDVAGGMGTFLKTAVAQHPGLMGTLLELPETACLARDQLEGSALADKIVIVDGDILQDDLPGEHDAVILANVIHLFSPETNRTLLDRLRRSVAAGARLLLVDFWTDPPHTQPAFAALLAGTFHMMTGEGDVYSVDEAEDFLAATNWRMVSHDPLVGAASLIVAEAC